MYDVIVGDCLTVLPTLEANSVDAIVTDPPYGLSFMGKSWDHAVPGPEFFEAMLRVAKPGAHLLAFGGTRLYHRLTAAIEDAGWEIRDCLMWLYGSGFPKSHDVSKAIDREAGAEREVVSRIPDRWAGKGCVYRRAYESEAESVSITVPATEDAKRWSGWGTALKPAWEPIVLARKPLDGTVASNHLRHGCGGLNIDGCRVDAEGSRPHIVDDYKQTANNAYSGRMNGSLAGGSKADGVTTQGRWPANLIHDGSDEATAGMGDAARYFYCPKASKKDRGEGNKHPTVKPHDLMRYLCRLITPKGGTVLDPFSGSGSTGKAAVAEGFNFIGIEMDSNYAEISRARIAQAVASRLSNIEETLNV